MTDEPEHGICENARKVDSALIELDRRIDWLYHLSPTHNRPRWDSFAESGYRKVPALTYPEIDIDLNEVRRDLQALPVVDIKESRIAALLRAKQRELDLQIELLRMRDTDGFVDASIELFGTVEPSLLDDAQDVLTKVEREPDVVKGATARDLAKAAEQEIGRYRDQVPNIVSQVELVPDLNSLAMVNHGHLLIDSDAHIDRERIVPLVAHEVGIHVLTRYNGSLQPLKLFEVGTAHYDALQEGLGTFAEYLVGYLPPSRLRVLAARVLATRRAIDRESIESIFFELHEEHGVEAGAAFDTAVRAKRGGGLTKDACYLRGLKALLSRLKNGEEFETFLCGKFDLDHLSTVKQLLEDGLLKPAVLKPTFLNDEATHTRLAAARSLDVTQLYQKAKSQ